MTSELKESTFEAHMDHLKELIQIFIKLLCIIFDIQDQGFNVDDYNLSSITPVFSGKSETNDKSTKRRPKRKISLEPAEESKHSLKKPRGNDNGTSAPIKDISEVTTTVQLGCQNLGHTLSVGEQVDQKGLSTGTTINAQAEGENTIIARKLLDMLICPISAVQQNTALALLKSDSKLQQAFIVEKQKRGKNKIIAYKHARGNSNPKV